MRLHCTHAPQEPEAGEAYGTIRGAVRFGDGACIGDGYFMSAHGGSIETALDEATAELVSRLSRWRFPSVAVCRRSCEQAGPCAHCGPCAVALQRSQLPPVPHRRPS